MNTYIAQDFINGSKFLKCGLMNSLHKLINTKESMIFKQVFSINFLSDCLNEFDFIKTYTGYEDEGKYIIRWFNGEFIIEARGSLLDDKLLLSINNIYDYSY